MVGASKGTHMNPVVTTSRPSTPPIRRVRYFWLSMAIGGLALALLAFVPEYLEFARGNFPIAGALHIHGAIMIAWVLAFVGQAYFVASGQLALHRKFGNVAFALATIAWLSMLFVEGRALIVHPPPDDVREYDWLLQGPYVYLTVPVLLLWGFKDRRRPDWHKRSMLMAMFLALQAAVLRFMWLPDGYGYWPFAGFLDACLFIPLFSYDLATTPGRLHRATIRGALLIVGAQAALFILWGTPLWRHFAAAVVQAAQSF